MQLGLVRADLVATVRIRDAAGFYAYVAIRDAFDALRRQLEDFMRIRNGAVKTHAPIKARSRNGSATMATWDACVRWRVAAHCSAVVKTIA